VVATLHTVRVDPGAVEDSEDLVAALSERGLEARRVGRSEVEVATVGEEGLWNLEVVSALEAWLEETEHDELTATLGETTFTVKAPGEREAEPRPARSGFDPVLIAAGLGTLLLAAAGLWFLVAALSQLF
jgi:hypothetical protein